jgi:hypothetical protein
VNNTLAVYRREDAKKVTDKEARREGRLVDLSES